MTRQAGNWIRRMAIGTAATLLLGALLSDGRSAFGQAADPKVVDGKAVDTKAVDTKAVDGDERAAPSTKQSAMRRATQVRGMNATNERGEDLGQLHDLMIELQAGRVAYAAIAYGGALGIGQKYFAVPLSALRLRPTADRKEMLVLPVAKADFETRPGFKNETWPASADASFAGAAGDTSPQRPGDTSPQRPGDTSPQRPDPESRATTKQTQQLRTTTLIGMNVKNLRAEDLGAVRDLMIDMQDGRVAYVAVGVGGTLGIGERLVAVPWNAFGVASLTGSVGDIGVVLNIDKATLEKATGFDKEAWPAEADRSLFETAARDRQTR